MPPSAAERLRRLVLRSPVTVCQAVPWGQAPGLATTGDSRVNGMLEPGDAVYFLMHRPNEHGEIRVMVATYDGRVVGRSRNHVWINWAAISRGGLDRVIFS